jgi:arsenate reductase
VQFLCTYNASHSQMAEGLLRARGGAGYEALSAGTEPRGIHPLAIVVMAELASGTLTWPFYVAYGQK